MGKKKIANDFFIKFWCIIWLAAATIEVYMKKKIYAEEVIALYESGKTTYEIAELVSCNPSTIQRFLKRQGITLRSYTVEILGKEFGKLKVLEQISKAKFLCQCSCGKFKECYKKRLLDGRNTSCGCSTNRSGSENGSWCGHEDITGSFWASIRSSADRRKISLEITIEDAWDLFITQDKKCKLTGIDLVMPDRQYSRVEQSPNLASLDRIDSNKPYTKENCQWLLREVNIMKMDLEEKRFLQICQMIVDNQ